MIRHLSEGSFSRKMGIEEKMNHDGAYQYGRSYGAAKAKRQITIERYGNIIKKYLLWVPAEYHEEVWDLSINRLAETDQRSPDQMKGAMRYLQAVAREARDKAKALGLDVPGPLDVEGHLPPSGLFTEVEMINARRKH